MRRPAVLLFTLVVAVMAVGIVERPVFATAITVSSTVDDSTTNGNCTLREAITAANTNAAVDVCSAGQPLVTDTIKFNISGTGPHTISPTSALPDITGPVTIDGYSQPGASPNTLAVGNDAVLQIELSGPGAQSGVSGLKIEADNSTVRGLVINKWDNAVFLNVDTTGNTVRGNFIGTDAAGSDPLGNNIGVVLTNALNNTIGGPTAAARNVISDNGIGISISGGTSNEIQGNYIGTNAAGNNALGNFQGMVLSNTPNNAIGGTEPGARNVISGNDTWGVRITDPESTGNKVQGNYIGTDKTGTFTDPDGTPNSGDELGNGLNGVSILAGAANNTIGGTKAAAGNIISGNGNSGANPSLNTLSGVEIQFSNSDAPNKASGNRILSNSIYDNAKLGIDLYHTNDSPGVTSNDLGDTDGGPNNLQNFPVITSARTRRGVTTIRGTLNSNANTTYTIQFFSSLEADASGFGEGQKFRGQKSVTTNDSGNAAFTFKTRRKITKGLSVTATATVTATAAATDQTKGDTSEFSHATTVS